MKQIVEVTKLGGEMKSIIYHTYKKMRDIRVLQSITEAVYYSEWNNIVKNRAQIFILFTFKNWEKLWKIRNYPLLLLNLV